MRGTTTTYYYLPTPPPISFHYHWIIPSYLASSVVACGATPEREQQLMDWRWRLHIDVDDRHRYHINWIDSSHISLPMLQNAKQGCSIEQYASHGAIWCRSWHDALRTIVVFALSKQCIVLIYWCGNEYMFLRYYHYHPNSIQSRHDDDVIEWGSGSRRQW